MSTTEKPYAYAMEHVGHSPSLTTDPTDYLPEERKSLIPLWRHPFGLDAASGLPGLRVQHGSSGIEIAVKLSQKFDCVEFTLNDNPQPVFVSPWMQFEPSAMSDERHRIASEIARRAVVHDNLLAEIEKQKGQIRGLWDQIDALRDSKAALIDVWKADRAKHGLPADFSDVTGWTRETMSDFRFTDAAIMRKALEELAGVTDTLCNGIEWNIENHPTVMNQSDEEALAAGRAAVQRTEAVIAGDFKGRE